MIDLLFPAPGGILRCYSGRYREAIELYKGVLRDKVIGVPFEYKVYCDLEVCYRELKDFEGAYKYSQLAKKLFEDMQQ